jgi:hypothetical protein
MVPDMTVGLSSLDKPGRHRIYAPRRVLSTLLSIPRWGIPPRRRPTDDGPFGTPGVRIPGGNAAFTSRTDRSTMLDALPLPVLAACCFIAVIVVATFAWILLRPDKPV